MKHYRVLDYNTKAKSGEISLGEVTSMVYTFVGLLGTKKEDLRIIDVQTGIEMTYEEFMRQYRMMDRRD